MNENLAIAEKGSVGRRIAANTGLMVGSKALGAVFGVISLIVAIRTLPIEDVGIILFLHAYMLFFAEVATFQSWQAVIRFGTDHVKNNDTKSLGSLLRFCIALDVLGAVAAFVFAVMGLMVFAQFLPDVHSSGANGVVLNSDKLVRYGVVYCLLILVHQGGASTGVFRLFDSFKPLAFHTLVMPALRLVGVIIAALNGAGVVGFLGAWFCASLIGYLVLPALALFELKSRNLMKCVFGRWPSLRAHSKEFWPFVWKANIDAVLATGTTHLPVLLVMPIFGPAYVSVYKVAEEISKLLSEGVLLLDRVIYPEYARMIARGDGEHIWRIVMRTAGIMMLTGFGACVVVALAGPWVIHAAAGAEYNDAVGLSILLVFAASFMGVAAPLYPVFYALGRPGGAIIARGAGLLFYIALVFVLSRFIGTMGPGWAAIGGNVFAILLAVFLAKRALDAHAQKPEIIS